MNKQKKPPVYLPLTHALAWIVGSTLVFSGFSYMGMKHYFKQQRHTRADPQLFIRSIIQTGPQKEALKTEYLAELMGVSANRLEHVREFDLEKAAQRLLLSPLISQAEVKCIEPATLYIDYTVRQPIAWLEDYTNVVFDKEGYPFPFSPFFTPKKLPAIYLGLGPFGETSSDPDREVAQWHAPLKGKYFALALDILKHVTDPKVEGLFLIKRIDVSNAFAESAGTREIVILTEDVISKRIDGKDVELCVPRILRLSSKNYPQELGNYLKLREQLLEEEAKFTPPVAGGTAAAVRLPEKIIDFRIQKLAFIEERKNLL
jgi:hypothetical protein